MTLKLWTDGTYYVMSLREHGGLMLNLLDVVACCMLVGWASVAWVGLCREAKASPRMTGWRFPAFMALGLFLFAVPSSALVWVGAHFAHRGVW